MSYEHCHEALKNSKLTTFISNKFLSLQWNLLHWLETHTYEEFKTKKNDGINFDIPIPIDGFPVPFNLNADFSEEQYKSLQEKIHEGKIEKIDETSFEQFILQFEPKHVYDTWLTCMLAMIQQSSKGRLNHSVSIQGKEIIVTLSYYPVNANDSYPIVEAFHISDNLTCKMGCLVNGFQINNDHAIVLEKINDEVGSIVIDTDKEVLQIPINASKPSEPKPPEPKPIEITESEKEAAILGLKKYVEDCYKKRLEQQNKKFSIVDNKFEILVFMSGYIGITEVSVIIKKFEVTGDSVFFFEVALNAKVRLHKWQYNGSSGRNYDREIVASKLIDLNKIETLGKESISFNLNEIEGTTTEDFSLSLYEIASLILKIVN
ncbi:hypothetical protein P4K54_23750 [Bacillus cereus]|uniref:hypothetical protein n=1 Tax=Bacillus cereus TaxID=1396 RepID=UPI000BF720CA|nr:hypothetical protein [Bacillus cereus]MEB9822084.1 hypothetical protein [Bacillus cereus]MEB9828479.1 hypothetical protein [Bacillus cereus]PES03531.1 hypothetical protein CN480_19640 [Bacillus cereus]